MNDVENGDPLRVKLKEKTNQKMITQSFTMVTDCTPLDEVLTRNHSNQDCEHFISDERINKKSLISPIESHINFSSESDYDESSKCLSQSNREFQNTEKSHFYNRSDFFEEEKSDHSALNKSSGSKTMTSIGSDYFKTETNDKSLCDSNGTNENPLFTVIKSNTRSEQSSEERSFESNLSNKCVKISKIADRRVQNTLSSCVINDNYLSNVGESSESEFRANIEIDVNTQFCKPMKVSGKNGSIKGASKSSSYRILKNKLKRNVLMQYPKSRKFKHFNRINFSQNVKTNMEKHSRNVLYKKIGKNSKFGDQFQKSNFSKSKISAQYVYCQKELNIKTNNILNCKQHLQTQVASFEEDISENVVLNRKYSVCENLSANLISSVGDEYAKAVHMGQLEDKKRESLHKVISEDIVKKIIAVESGDMNKIIDKSEKSDVAVEKPPHSQVQSRRRRTISKSRFRMNQEVHEQCCGHWFPNTRCFINHLIKNSHADDSLHSAKLIAIGMERCSLCCDWLTVNSLKKHMKKLHDKLNDDSCSIPSNKTKIVTDQRLYMKKALKTPDVKDIVKERGSNYENNAAYDTETVERQREKGSFRSSSVINEESVSNYQDKFLEPDANDSTIKCNINYDSNELNSSFTLYTENDLPAKFRPSIIMKRCELDMESFYLNKSSKITADKVGRLIKRKPLNIKKKKKSFKSQQVSLKDTCLISKEESIVADLANKDCKETCNVEMETLVYKGEIKTQICSGEIQTQISNEKIQTQIGNEELVLPHRKFGKRSRRSLDNFSAKRLCNRRIRKNGKANFRKRRKCGFNSSDSSDSSSCISDFNSDTDDLCENDLNENDYYVPTVILDLFTLSAFDADDSVLLLDPRNPDFKIFASMDAIFVGDSALEDLTNQIGYISDINNVVFVSPDHFLFPHVENSYSALPTCLSVESKKSKSNSLNKESNQKIGSRSENREREKVLKFSNDDKENAFSKRKKPKKLNKSLKQESMIPVTSEAKFSAESLPTSSVASQSSKSTWESNITKVKIDEQCKVVDCKSNDSIDSFPLSVPYTNADCNDKTDPFELNIDSNNATKKKFVPDSKIKSNQEISKFNKNSGNNIKPIKKVINLTTSAVVDSTKRPVSLNTNSNKQIKKSNIFDESNRSKELFEKVDSNHEPHSFKTIKGNISKSKSPKTEKVIIIKASMKENSLLPKRIRVDNSENKFTISVCPKRGDATMIRNAINDPFVLGKDETLIKMFPLKPVCSPKTQSNIDSFKVIADFQNPTLPNNIDYSKLEIIEYIDQDLPLMDSQPASKVSTSNISIKQSEDLTSSFESTKVSSPKKASLSQAFPFKISLSCGFVVASTEIDHRTTLEDGLCLEEVMDDYADKILLSHPSPLKLLNRKNSPKSPSIKDRKSSQNYDDTPEISESNSGVALDSNLGLNDIVKGKNLWSTPIIFSPKHNSENQEIDPDDLPLTHLASSKFRKMIMANKKAKKNSIVRKKSTINGILNPPKVVYSSKNQICVKKSNKSGAKLKKGIISTTKHLKYSSSDKKVKLFSDISNNNEVNKMNRQKRTAVENKNLRAKNVESNISNLFVNESIIMRMGKRRIKGRKKSNTSKIVNIHDSKSVNMTDLSVDSEEFDSKISDKHLLSTNDNSGKQENKKSVQSITHKEYKSELRKDDNSQSKQLVLKQFDHFNLMNKSGNDEDSLLNNALHSPTNKNSNGSLHKNVDNTLPEEDIIGVVSDSTQNSSATPREVDNSVNSLSTSISNCRIPIPDSLPKPTSLLRTKSEKELVEISLPLKPAKKVIIPFRPHGDIGFGCPIKSYSKKSIKKGSKHRSPDSGSLKDIRSYFSTASPPSSSSPLKSSQRSMCSDYHSSSSEENAVKPQNPIKTRIEPDSHSENLTFEVIKNTLPGTRGKRKWKRNQARDIRSFFCEKQPIHQGIKSSPKKPRIRSPNRIKSSLVKEELELNFEGFDGITLLLKTRLRDLQLFVDVLHLNTLFDSSRFPLPVDELCEWDDDRLSLILFEKG